MAIVCLLRHGQASFGAADYDALSDLGRDQAVAAGDELARRGLRDPLVVSGRLRRQRDTAALLGLGPVPSHDPRWNEYDHLVRGDGDGGGQDPPADPRAFQARLDTALTAWIEADREDGWRGFRGGAVDALAAVRDRLEPGQDAVVVTSGGVIAAVVGSLLGVPAAGVVALNRVMVNASMTTVLLGSTGTSLLSFNEHAYLGARRTYR